MGPQFFRVNRISALLSYPVSFGLFDLSFNFYIAVCVGQLLELSPQRDNKEGAVRVNPSFESAVLNDVLRFFCMKCFWAISRFSDALQHASEKIVKIKRCGWLLGIPPKHIFSLSGRLFYCLVFVRLK